MKNASSVTSPYFIHATIYVDGKTCSSIKMWCFFKKAKLIEVIYVSMFSLPEAIISEFLSRPAYF